MSLKFPDYAAESACTLNAGGTEIALSGTAISKHRTFANAEGDTNIDFDDGDTVAIDITDAGGDIATWIGTYDTTGDGTITKVSVESAQGSLATESAELTVYASVPGNWFAHTTLADNAQTPVSTDITGAIGQYYLITQSSQSANIDFTLPSASIGDRIGVYMVDGDDTYAVIIKGAASQTINGGSAATEWSRLFIQGETCIFRCVAANTWIIEHDGRIPCCGKVKPQTDVTGNSAGTYTVIDLSGSTAEINIGDMVDIANDKMNIRRDGRYIIRVAGRPYSSVADGDYYGVGWGENTKSTATELQQFVSPASTTGVYQSINSIRDLSAGDYIAGIFRAQSANDGFNGGSDGITWFIVEEQL